MTRWLALSALALSVAGCATDVEEDAVDTTEQRVEEEDRAGGVKSFPEAVQLYSSAYFCTGVLVSARVVLTAGHCAGASKNVIAPNAPGGKMTGVVQTVTVLGTDASPDQRDLAIVTLKKPMNVGTFATPTTGAAGKTGTAVGRRVEASKGALVRTKPMAIASAPDYGAGLRTQWYSDGGDSGGPLFLIENGTATHKVVGIERQPDPPVNRDYFTGFDGETIGKINDAIAAAN